MDQLVAAARQFDREEDSNVGDEYSLGGANIASTSGSLGEDASRGAIGSIGDGGLERLRRYLDSMQLAAEEEVGLMIVAIA